MTQPEPLRLADQLERDKWHVPAVVMQAAADELRWLHASCEDYARHKQRQDQRVLELADSVLKLTAQRDALLEALKDALFHVANQGDVGVDQWLVCERNARATIAVCENGTKPIEGEPK
jgi:hypothetical protein